MIKNESFANSCKHVFYQQLVCVIQMLLLSYMYIIITMEKEALIPYCFLSCMYNSPLIFLFTNTQRTFLYDLLIFTWRYSSSYHFRSIKPVDYIVVFHSTTHIVNSYTYTNHFWFIALFCKGEQLHLIIQNIKRLAYFKYIWTE